MPSAVEMMATTTCTGKKCHAFLGAVARSSKFSKFSAKISFHSFDHDEIERFHDGPLAAQSSLDGSASKRFNNESAKEP